MKTKIFKLLSAILFFIMQAQAQTITPKFFGQNAWMPDSVGNVAYNGDLNKQWGKIAASSPGIVRFGGTSVDKNMPTISQYLKMVDSIRAKGMEPMLQVPFANYKYSAAQAANIVRMVNVVYKRNVKYWVIGNEPDLAFGFNSSSQIAPYIKSFSSAMKTVDPTIQIIGPECAWYNKGILYGLTTPGGPDDITGKDANGRYYIDYISFHTYPFSGAQNRQEVISKLNNPGEFNDNLAELKSRVAQCNNANGRTGENAVKMALTEANIDYQDPAGDNLWGVGANSFLGGQFWAEMMGIAMKNGVSLFNFWAVVEGKGSNTNIGYISGNDFSLKPSYYHFQMMAQNFRGNYVNSSDNLANTKTYASMDNSRITVMILNEDQASSLNYTVKLNNTSVSGSSTLKVNVEAGVNKEYTDFISAQSTALLVFDKSGNLIKKIEYKLSGHADKNLPPVVTNFMLTGTHDNGNGENSFSVKMYPNPAKEYFTLEAAGLANEVRLEMFNMAGQVVANKTLSLTSSSTKQRIELDQNLASGMYVAVLTSGANKFTQKMVVVK